MKMKLNTTTMDLFEQKKRRDLTEPEVAEMLGVCMQTLRNWRVGYSTYPPRLTEGVQWYKLRNTRRAPVMYDLAWVESMLEARQNMKEVLP